MKYTNGYHGMIWEVKLSDELGYAYIKTIEPNRIIDKGHIGFLGQILHHRSQSSFRKMDVELFKETNPLCAPFLLVGHLPGNGKDRWKALGHSLTGEEEVPVFKGLSDFGDKIENSVWHIIEGSAAVDVLPDSFCYRQTKHLNFFNHLNALFFIHRIRMEWMRLLELNYSSYSHNQTSISLLEKQKWHMQYTTNLQHIPKEYWHQPLP